MYEEQTRLSENNETKTTLLSRNITVCGRRTSVRLEPEMWRALKEIAKREECTIHDICSLIGIRKNENTSLTAAIRVFLMLYFRASSTEQGHERAGHGDFENMKKRARLPIQRDRKQSVVPSLYDRKNALEDAALVNGMSQTQSQDRSRA